MTFNDRDIIIIKEMLILHRHKCKTIVYSLITAANHINGEIPIVSMFIVCYLNKVYSINLAFDKRYGHQVTDHFITAYGKFFKTDQTIDRYFWYGQRVILSVKYNPADNTSLIIFTNKKLNGLYETGLNNARSRIQSGDN